MEMQEVLNSKAVRGFIKGSFAITGLIVVLSYGFVALVLIFEKKLDCKDLVLILLFSVIPLFAIIIFGFIYIPKILKCLRNS